MLSRLELLVDLLHSAAEAALATHSVVMDSYPFASSVAFAADEHHRPILLISALAEHTRNLAANSRASLLVARQLGAGETARVSLVGDVRPIDAEPLLVQRYLRYHPHAEAFLQLGDFRFHRFEPVRILTVGGFGKASWLEGQRLLEAPVLSLADEAIRLEQVAGLPDRELLGIDAYGADIQTTAGRQRIRFAAGPVTADALLPTLARELGGVGPGDGK